MLLDDLQLEETDTIDEVESSDDSEFEVVEAPVNDEEPEQPEESPSVMELLLDVDEDSTENDAGADDNSAEPSKEQKSLEERVQAIVEKCAQKSETTTAARRNRPDLLTQASVVYHFENISKSKKATARAFGFSEAGGAKQVRGYVSKKQEIMGLLTHMRSKNKSLRSRKQVRASGVSAAHPELEKRVVAWRAAELAAGRKVRPANLWTQVKKVRAFYDPAVKVFFQKKAVVDQNLMAEIYAYWEKYFGNQLRLLIGDSCRAHFTKKAKVCPNMVTNMDFNLVLKSRDAFFVAGKCKEGDILRSFGGGHHFCGSVFGHRAQFCMEEPLQQYLWR